MGTVKLPSSVYAIRCTKTGRMYIGCTSRVEQRIRTHFSELRHNNKRELLYDINGKKVGTCSEGSLWQQEYNKYGADCFEVYILEENIKPADRAEREQYWSDKYKTLDPRYGYNSQPPVKRKIPMLVDGLPPLPEESKGKEE